MSDSPLVAPRAEGRARARPAAPRRLGADALLARRGRGRFRDRRDRRRRRHAGLQAGRRRVFGGRVRCRPVLAPARGFRLGRDDRRRSSTGSDERIIDGDNPLQLGTNNSGQSVGGSTVHFQMVSLRFRPEWFKSRSRLGYAVDWPVDPEEMWHYYGEVEEALKISGPVNYPWGPQRPRYPYRAHEINAAGLVLARGCEALGIAWATTPLATLSAPRGEAHPCVYRGFCTFGCSTNAKQSALVTWIPRAIRAGAEIRDLAMVGRIEIGHDGRATGVHYHREGKWRLQRASNVVVAGYAIETPRLLLNSACAQFPGRARQQQRPGRQELHGAVEPGGLRHLRGGDPLVQGAAVAGDHRALELHRSRQGFPRRLRLYEPGAAGRSNGRSTVGPRARAVGHGTAQRDGEVQPHGRAEDRRRGAAATRTTASSWPTRPTNTGCASRA